MTKVKSSFAFHDVQNNLDHEEEDLHGADDGEAREKPHGASDSGQEVHKLCFSVLRSR